MRLALRADQARLIHQARRLVMPYRFTAQLQHARDRSGSGRTATDRMDTHRRRPQAFTFGATTFRTLTTVRVTAARHTKGREQLALPVLRP